jgi:DNA-binding transcriptional regulator YiaG
MKKKIRSVRPGRPEWSLDPAIADALNNLKELVQSSSNRLRVIQEVAELRKKGVQLKVLAEYCGVAPGTIAQWQARASKSERVLFKGNSRRDVPTQAKPQLRVLDVIQSERKDRFWPKINLRAEWVRFRFNFELV